MDKESIQPSLARFENREKYRIEEVLRQGESETTEIVYQIAVDGSSSGPFIRKRFSDPGLYDLYSRMRDAQVNGLRDPGLPKIYEVEQDGEGFCAVVEFVQGENLRCADISPKAAFEDTCRVVQILHDQFDPPIIHRDIKPDNIIAVKDGVVLIDFGAARTLIEGKDRDTHLYATRAYAPPEQFGYAQTDCRSDIYSLGMLLAFLETGKDPDADFKQAVRSGEHALVEKGISRPAAKTIIRACAFDPSLRFNTVSGMLDFYHAEIEAKARRQIAQEQWENFAPNTNSSEQSPAYTEPIQLDPRKEHFVAKAKRLKSQWDAGAYIKVGAAWDIIVAVIWTFFLAVSISLCFNPGEEYSSLPIWLRAVEYVGIVMTLLTFIGVTILDWRPIRSIPRFSRMKRRYILIPAAIIFFACIIIASASGY